MPQDPYHRDDEKGAACRLAVAKGELSLHPDADNYIGNYIFYGINNGKPAYISIVNHDPDNNEGERAEYEALNAQARSTGRIY